MRGYIFEIGIAAFGLIVYPLWSQVDIAGAATGAATSSQLQNWLQFGLSVALVLIHTLWTIPGMQKDARDERKQFLDEITKQREGWKCHGAVKT